MSKRRTTRSAATKAKATRLEREARAAGDLELAAALSFFGSMPLERRREVIHEIILTRREELLLAYPQVRAVGSGFRQTETREGGAETLVRTREPVVVFFVHRKWSAEPRSEAARKKRLPRTLLTFAVDAETGERRLCAVPTDVQRVGRRARAQGPAMIRVTEADGERHKGMVTCGVRMKHRGAERLMAASCFHVLWPAKRSDVAPAEVGLRESGEPLGSPDRVWAGALHPASLQRASHDAAFVPIGDGQRAALAEAVDGLEAIATVKATQLMPMFARVLTSQNGALDVALPQMWAPCSKIDYGLPGPGLPFHQHLYEWTIENGKTSPGDSGSPIVSRDGLLLLGMHLAGVDDSSFMLPIFDVLNPTNLDGAPAGAVLRLEDLSSG